MWGVYNASQGFTLRVIQSRPFNCMQYFLLFFFCSKFGRALFFVWIIHSLCLSQISEFIIIYFSLRSIFLIFNVFIFSSRSFF